jgi:hypothetical protein
LLKLEQEVADLDAMRSNLLLGSLDQVIHARPFADGEAVQLVDGAQRDDLASLDGYDVVHGRPRARAAVGVDGAGSGAREAVISVVMARLDH